MRVAVPLVLLALGACVQPGAVVVRDRVPRGVAPVPEPGGMPARYLVASRAIVERADGVSRLVAGGRRLEVVDGRIDAVGGPDPHVDHGARVPPWRRRGASSYLFWSQDELFAADGFLRSPRLVASFDAKPLDASDWLTGVALVFAGGARVYDADGSRSPLGVPAVVRAIAASATFGAVQTALGHAFTTIDGGAHFTDATAAFGGATSLEVRDGAIVASNDRGERAIGPDGKLMSLVPRAAPHDEPDRDDRFFAATGEAPLDVAMQSGLPLDDGGLLITTGRYIARFDLETLRTTSLVALPADLDESTCLPVRGGRDVLLACVSTERATLLDVAGAPRIERTFDLVGASDVDRFIAGGDDAIGFLGACDGSPLHVPDAEGDSGNASPQRAEVFCVRRGADDWVERRVTPGEAGDVIAWIPRAGGDAIALLARAVGPGADAESVSVRGGLRVVTVPLARLPLMTASSFERKGVLTRLLRAMPDGAIEGWLPTNVTSGAALAPARIDAEGHGHAYPPPVRFTSVEHAGRFGLGATEDARLFETIDSGRSWTLVRPPPISGTAPLVVDSCSLAGCTLGAFDRLGWGVSPLEAAPSPRSTMAPRPARGESTPRSSPFVKLSCAPAGPPEGARTEIAGLAFGPPGRTVGDSRALGNVGIAEIPDATPGSLALAQLAWIDPLSPKAPIRRRAVPIPSLAPMPHGGLDLQVGPLLTSSGAVELFAVGRRNACASQLFEAAGLGRSLGGCMPDGSLAVELAASVVGLHIGETSIEIWAAEDADDGSASAKGSRKTRGSLRRLRATEVGAPLEGFLFGIGERAGAPVVVAVDLTGDAVLSAVAPRTGVLGLDERLASLRSATLGSSASCASSQGEARVILPLTGAIGLDSKELPSVRSSQGQGMLVARWSARRLCVDALELPVGDSRFEGPEYGTDTVAVRKLVARFDHGADAALILAAAGDETRQRLRCTSLESVAP